MRFLYTDESNVNPNESEFFIYAGVAIDADLAGCFSDEIGEIRARHGYKPEDSLKFNTHQRPAYIGPAAHLAAKSELLDAAAKYTAVMFASFLLHKIATSPDEARRNEINRVCYHFNCYLAREKDRGLVLLDTFTDKELTGHLREKFATGLTGPGFPYSRTLSLPQIVEYHLASVGTSHLCSVVDIVLGSLRFAVNAIGESGHRQDVAMTLLKKIAPLCLRTHSGKADELSVFFSPKVVKRRSFLAKYEALHAFLAANGIEAAQVPTDIPCY